MTFYYVLSNFLLSGNIHSAPVYEVFVSQFKRYDRACSKYAEFLYRARLLTNRLLEQGYIYTRLKYSLLNSYVRHHELVMDRYGVSIYTMRTDLFNVL